MAAPFAKVAVPAPLPEALTYEVPDEWDELALPGVRVRVPLGRRKLVGVVVERTPEAPPGIELKPLIEVIDREPVLSAELLELAGFVAGYYLSPLGETVRSLLPGKLPPWGDRKVWLTDAGAIAPPRDGAERQVIEAVRQAGRLSLTDLRQEVRRPDVARVVDRLIDDGRLASGDRRNPAGTRYRSAVDLAPGTREVHEETAGRSKEGRAVVTYLAALGRPALVSEVTAAVGCSDAVVRRLIQLGVLRRFTQVERLDLARHRLRLSTEETPIVLRPDQAAAVEALVTALGEGAFAPFLLAGMTGSGKTEVYLRAAEETLAIGRTVIVLVPEIALVPALARTLELRFGSDLAILHSSLSAGERHQEWERIRRGEARMVLGPRSAVFAPVDRLGLLVVDEEQDGSYKQDQAPRYHGRDIALVRARAAGAVAVLTSATPSFESRLNVEQGKLTPLTLTRRAGRGELPRGVLVDLRGQAPRRPGSVHFSEVLKEELARTFAAGDQAILLRNRRGYAPILLCRACGEDHRCAGCGLPRTLHRREAYLVCHYCGDSLPTPAKCPACGEAALDPMGSGTERVEEDFAALFPEVPVDVLDRDTARRPGGVASVLEAFAHGETQALIGTQMVSKGHHFPRVALAAVLSADTYLGFPDFRAVERTYDLLVQLAGRAGRGDRPGKVVIQTYHPEHYAIQAALAHDDQAFAREELRFRRVFHYPPYTRMVQLLVRDRSREKAEDAARELARRVTGHPRAGQVRISGPAPAPLERLRDRWRFQLLLRGYHGKLLREIVARALADPPGAEVVVDVDPVELL